MRFSIIVPIYNIEEYIEQCVNSLLMQNYDNYEIILVDDGGKDRCPQICDEFAQRSNKIKVIHKNNGGLVSARNAGVEIATGDYIGYVDGDDWVEPNLLYRLNEILKHNQVDVINFGFYNNIDGIDKKEPNCKHKGLFDKNLLEKYVFPSMIFDEAEGFFSFGVIPAVWCKFYKESVLRENLCKDDKITFGEDVACSYFCLWFRYSSGILTEQICVQNFD